MKRLLFIAFAALSINAVAQTNTFPSSGNVGIGTTTPLNGINVFKLNDYNGGSIRFGYSGANDGSLSLGWNPSTSRDAMKFSYFPHNSLLNQIDLMTLDINGNVGIGTTSPTGKLEISGGNIIINRPSNKVDRNGISEFSAFEINNSFISGQTGYVKVFYPSYNNLLFGADYDGNIGGVQPNIQFGQKSTPFLTVVNNGNYTGNVGIGTQNPAYKLDVLGTIRAKEVLVNLDGGADFVFEKGYKLLSIEHVASYVLENKHLPDIPSANEMTKNGVSMGEMQVKLLQKVEEQTLYIIGLNNELQVLKKQIKELQGNKQLID